MHYFTFQRSLQADSLSHHHASEFDAKLIALLRSLNDTIMKNLLCGLIPFARGSKKIRSGETREYVGTVHAINFPADP